MATTTVSDIVILTKHVHGDASLATRLSELTADAVLDLRVDGVEGAWRKVDDGTVGRPTSGLRPFGNAQDFWRRLYLAMRGQVVEIEVTAARPQSDIALPVR